MDSPNTPSVLLVEDSPVQAAAIKMVLEKTGHTVHTATDGEAALLVMGEEQLDLVLTDLNMPGLSGLELLQITRRQYPDLPVILMTGDGNEDVAAAALKNGAASYIGKDRSMGALLETIDRIVAASSSAHSFGYLLDSIESCRYSFALTSDRALIVSLVHYVQHLASRAGLVEKEELRNLGVAVEETLLNALYHGSLEVPQGFREMEQDARAAFVRERCAISPYKERRIRVTIEVDSNAVELMIRDEGPGFNYADRFGSLSTNNATFDVTEGMRGLILMQMFIDEVEFRGAGNEVRLRKSLTPSTHGG